MQVTKILPRKLRSGYIDWWLFSKIDEHLDNLYILYYDPENKVIRCFKPDLSFWIQKE
jgi:hypothetical protein